MKKIFIILICLCTLFAFCACGESSKESSTSDLPQSNTEATKEKKLSADELNAELKKQPCYVYETEYYVQDDNYKSLYPDLLLPKIKNQSDTNIKDVWVAFVAWDPNGLPVIIESTGDSGYIVECAFNGINLTKGETLTDYGLQLTQDFAFSEQVDKFKAIVTHYKDFDGNTWDNPLYSDWKEMYKEKELK